MRSLATELGRPRALAFVVVLALAVTLPSLTLGFVTDDYGFRAVLHAPPPHARPAYDLFRFATGDLQENAEAIRRGHLPWWTAPDLKIHFVRPLTGLLFAADTAVFGTHAVADHLHSIAWYLALVVAVGALYRRVFPSGATAALSLLVFAWSHAHVYVYAWLAARHVLVGGVPAVLAVWAHVRSRNEGWRPGRWLAPLALAVGLAGSEAALAGAIFWVSFDLLGERARPWRPRCLAATPAVAIVTAYLVVYRFVGGGARGSGGYHDPLGDFVGFAQVAATRIPILLGDALVGVPAELASFVSTTPLVIVGIVAALLLTLGYLACRQRTPDHEQAALRWMVPGALISTILGASGFPGGRVLVLPDIGFAALLGVLLAHGFERGALRVWRTVIASVLAIVHLLLAPVSCWGSTRRFAHRARASEEVARELAGAASPEGRVFLVASDPLVFLYPRGILADQHPGVVRCVSVLSAAHAGHRITRLDDRTLRLEPIERTLLDRSFDTLFRGPDRPFAIGDSVRQCGATFRVTGVQAGRPSRLDVQFDRSLDAESLPVTVWRDHRLERLDMPPGGATVEIPWSAGPSGL